MRLLLEITITYEFDYIQLYDNFEVLDFSKLGRNNIVFKEGLDKLKYRGGVVPRNTKNCVGCARCFFGCAVGAKQSVDKNFIAKAMEKGVTPPPRSIEKASELNRPAASHPRRSQLLRSLL